MISYFSAQWIYNPGSTQFNPSFFLKGAGGIYFSKNPNKGGMEKLLKGRWDTKRGDSSAGKGRCFQSGYFFQLWCGKCNYYTTFNYFLFSVFLFPLNVGVSPCCHFEVLVPVSIIQMLVPVTGYILPVCIMQVLLLVSFLKSVISGKLMRQCTHKV